MACLREGVMSQGPGMKPNHVSNPWPHRPISGACLSLQSPGQEIFATSNMQEWVCGVVCPGTSEHGQHSRTEQNTITRLWRESGSLPKRKFPVPGKEEGRAGKGFLLQRSCGQSVGAQI